MKILRPGKAKEYVFRYFYKNFQITDFNAYCCDFKNVIETILKPEAKKQIANRLQHSDEVFIVSASIENWIKPWANHNHINTIIATTIEVGTDGRLTGKFSSKNCNYQEKVSRVLKQFPNIKKGHLTVYGNSKGDKALMTIADKTYYKTLS